jgi:hypothetical protein
MPDNAVYDSYGEGVTGVDDPPGGGSGTSGGVSVLVSAELLAAVAVGVARVGAGTRGVGGGT